MQQNLHEKVQIKDNIPARGIHYSNANQLVTNHWHNSLEIITVTEGCLELGIAEDIYHIYPGELAIIDSGAIHYTQVIGYTSIYAIQIPHQVLSAHIPDYQYVCFRSAENSVLFSASSETQNLHDLIISFYEIGASKEIGFSLRCSMIIYEIIYILYTHYMTAIDKSIKSKNDWHLNRIKHVISYVNAHYSEPITLNDGANLLSLTPEYFCRYFKKYTGYTFLDYINTTRLTHIANDLQQTSTSVTELTEKHGFTNYKLFLKMFRKTYGCTPSEYRRAHLVAR